MDLSGRVSASDMQRVNDIRHHPQYEEGIKIELDKIRGYIL